MESQKINSGLNHRFVAGSQITALCTFQLEKVDQAHF